MIRRGAVARVGGVVAGALLVVAGCTPDVVLVPTKAPVADNDPILQVTPPAYQFGERASAEVVSQVFEVTNIGASTLDVDEVLLAGDASFTLQLLDTPPFGLVGSDVARVQVTFQPQATGLLDAALVVISDNADAREVRIPLQGIGARPELVVTPDPLDLGTRPIDCPTIGVVTVRNDGGEPLDVRAVTVVDGGDEITQPVPIAPFTLTRSQTRSVSVVLEALTLGSHTASLVVDSNDPGGVVTVPITGEVVPGAQATDRFEVPEERGVDILFAVDRSGSMSDQLQTLADEFGRFADLLAAANTDWRVGVYGGEDPICLQGGIIEPGQADWAARFTAAALAPLSSFALTASGNAALTEAHLEGVARFGQADLSGQCGTVFRRDLVPLHVVMISDERDQSTGFLSGRTDYWQDWVSPIETYAGDPALLTIHAIVDLQSQCGEAPLGPAGYVEAAQATGGRELDVCGTFADGLEDIANDVLAGLMVFELSHSDLDPSSITVTVDGVPTPSGWSYNADHNLVVFDEAVPAGGVVEVTYTFFHDCPA